MSTINKQRFVKNSLIGLAASLAAAVAVPSQAATVTYTLTKTSPLTNVNDAEGRWQYDGGDVYLGASKVGYYVRKKRISFGVPAAVNKSDVQITVIWAYGDYNFTLQGTHYFGTGREVGGVSATSAGFTAFSDATFAGSSSSLTISY